MSWEHWLILEVIRTNMLQEPVLLSYHLAKDQNTFMEQYFKCCIEITICINLMVESQRQLFIKDHLDSLPLSL